MNYNSLRLQNNLNNITETSRIIENQDVCTDLILSMCGKKLGSGCYRTTYEYNLDPKYVIKVERENTDSNMVEHILWDEIRGLKGSLAWVKDWFAPVKWISPNGKVLVMQKTHIKTLEPFPKKVPSFFMDVKADNFGWIGNKFVCHDYGFIGRFIEYRKKFTKIDW
jgi:hypothetical protein